MPNNNKTGPYKAPLQQTMPKKFRCKKGLEWKPLEAFATNQRKFLQRQLDIGGGINPAQSGMTCIEHAKQAGNEIRCKRCKLIKPAGEFSKNSRKNEVFECKRCVAWAETQEPDVTPTPLQSGHISNEETSPNWHLATDSGAFFVNANDDGQPHAPVTGFASLGLEDLEGKHDLETMVSEATESCSNSVVGQSHAASVVSGSVSGMSTGSLPPHLASKIRQQGTKAGSSVASSSKDAGEAPKPKPALPPHLRHVRLAPSSENVPLASSTAETSSYAASISTATTVKQDREKNAKLREVPYNAWDSRGLKHSGVKQPTVASSSVSTTSVTESENDKHVDLDSNIHGEWPIITMEEPQSRGKGSKWPKASESRIPQREIEKQPILSHTSVRHINPDIDRQQQMMYCDSDDSDY